MSQTDDKLENLKEHRDAILLAEIGALIHDLGKLSEYFIRKQSELEKDNYKDYQHSEILCYDSKLNEKYSPKDDKLKHRIVKLAKDLKVLLSNAKILDGAILDMIKEHHNKDNPPNSLVKLIIAADEFDSEEDRGKAKDSQKSIDSTFKSTAFGEEDKESLKNKNFEQLRLNIYLSLLDFLNNKISRRKLLEILKTNFSETLGMTARAANDVTLWDHSYMTASIMKALFGQCLLCSSIINKEISQENNNIDECEKFVDGVNKITSDFKKLIREYRPFQVFAIGWDFFDFIKQSHKIPDVIGRIEILKEIKEEVRKIVEEEYALGNSIYNDDFSIYFLIPSILDENDLKKVKEDIFGKFNEKINGVLLPIFHLELPKRDKGFRIGELLTEAMKNIRAKVNIHQIGLVTTPTWVENWKSDDEKLSEDKLICNVCGKDYFCIGNDEKICNTCKSLRNKGRKSEILQTVFIDEIAWNPENNKYENVCLLIAKFDLGEWLNGKFVQSLFIRTLEKYYDDITWNDGKTIPGLMGILGKTLKDKIRSNTWDEEAEKNVYSAVKSFLLDKIHILRGKSIESVACDVIKLIKKEIKKGKTLSDILNREKREHFISNIIFNFEYLDNTYSLKILKPPSPSRLMRVWNNTKEFFESIEKEICLNVPLIEEVILKTKDFKFENPAINKLTKNRAYLIEISDLGLQGEVICESNCDNPKELTVITPHLSAVLKKENDKVKDKEIIIKDVDTKRKIATAGILEIEKSRNVRAFRVISISPSLFMLIIPARESVKIVEIIRREYEKHFGKVFGKLPLHIGLIYFKRKMPIFTVLDSASRMLSEFGKLGKDGVKLRVASESKTNDNVTLTLTPNSESEQSSIRYEIKIPYKLGDGNIDYYHPYLIVDNTSEDMVEIKLDGETITQKHISKIKKGDRILAKKYLLDFEFLDSNIRRFDIGEKRKHWLFTDSANKPKPYLLWDIDNFEKLRRLIQKLGLTTTQIMNLYEMLIGKIGEWELKSVEDFKDDAFEKLVENTITSVPLRLKVVDGESCKGKISKQDFEFFKAVILNGMFFDFVDLWHTILKKKFEEGEKND